jgi:hypothetical protein
MTREQDYYAVDAVSHSRLREMRKSPAHYRMALDSPDEATEAMEFGRLIHCAVLEPSKLPLQFAVKPPDIDRRTKEGKAAWAEFQEAADGKTIVTEADMAMARSMADAVTLHPTAGDLVENAVLTGDVERPFFWRDTELGLDRKAKTDMVLPDGTVVDLKTTVDAGRDFRKSVIKYGYHTQAAYYGDALESVGREMRDFLIIAVEKGRPHGVVVYRLSADLVAAGRKTVRRWLRMVRECEDAKEWPGYPAGVIPLNAPEWFREGEDMEHWNGED